MSQSRHSILAVLLFHAFATLSAAAASAADVKVLELLPDDVLAAVVVPQLKSLDAKISSLGGPLKFPVPPPIATAMLMQGVQQGLDDAGAAAIALVPMSDNGETCGLGILPTSDLKKLISRFSPQDTGGGISQITVAGTNGLLVAQIGNYAVFVGPTADERKVLERALARKPGMPASLAPLADWAASQDAAFVVSHAGVKLAQKGLEAMKSAVPAFQQASSGPAMDAYKNLLAAVERETSQVGLGLHIENDATIRISGRAQLVAGGNWSKASASLSAPADPPMTGLPAGPYFIAYDGAFGGSTSDVVSDFSVSLMKPLLNDQNGKASDADLQKLATTMKGISAGTKSMAMVMNVPQPGTSLYSGAYSLQRVSDAQEFFKNYQTRIEEYKKVLKSLNSSMFADYDAKRSNVDGIDAVEISYSMAKQMEKMKADRPAAAPQMDAVWRLMFGNEQTMKTYLAPASKDAVVMVFMDASHLKPAIEAANRPATSLAADPDVKTTVGLLPAGSQWVFLLGPAGLMQLVKTTLQTVMPAIPMQFPDFPKTPPIGAAARVTAERLEAQIVVPAPVLEGIGTFVQQVQQQAAAR